MFAAQPAVEWPRSSRANAVTTVILGVLLGCQPTADAPVKTSLEPPVTSEATVEVDAIHAPDSAVYSADGVLIRYADQGSGPLAVMLIHGWNCDRSYWQLQQDFLAERYRVVSVDLAGHGESGRNRENWSIQAFGADVAAVAEKLELSHVVLVGHSMGASVALAANRQLGNRVRGVVVVDALRNPDKQMPPSSISAALDNMEADYSSTVMAIVQTMFVDASPARVRDYVIRDMAQSPPAVGKASLLALAAYDPMLDLNEIDVPLTLINSDYQPTDTELYARLLPDARIVEMNEVGHFVMLDDPTTFTGHLVEAIDASVAQP